MSLRRFVGVGCVSVATLAVGACGSSGSSSNSAHVAALAGKSIAVLDVFPQNPYLTVGVNAIKKEAQAHGVKVSAYGIASASPQAEFAAIQDAATKNAYDGYIVVPQSSVTDVPAVKKLVATGKPVVIDSIVVGTNNCTTQLQVHGLAGQALTPVCQVGQALGSLVKQACAGISKCNVVWTTGLPGFPGETAQLDLVKQNVSSIPGASLKQTSPTLYDTTTAINVLTNELNSNPTINVLITDSDAMYKGYLEAARKTGKKVPKIVATGATFDQIAALKAGKIFGVAVGNGQPATDSLYSMQLLEKALLSKENWGASVDTTQRAGLPQALTRANESQWASKFSGQYQV
jgi:ABC-type sugar transport system substrate-binding protein